MAVNRIDILMPAPDAGVESAILRRWYLNPGDHVSHGETLAEIETEDGKRFEIKLYEHGHIARILIGADRQVATGTPIAELKLDDESEIQSLHPKINLVEKYLSEPVNPVDKEL